MDFTNTKDLYFNGELHERAYLGDTLVWSKLRGEITKDFRALSENEQYEGIWNPSKGALVASNDFIWLPPTIKIIGKDHAEVQWGESFNYPQVEAYSISNGNLTPKMEIYRDGTKVNEVNTKVNGSYEIRYTATDSRGYIATTSYFINVVGRPKYRYVRDSIMRSEGGGSPYFRQVKVFDYNGNNIALNKNVTSVGPIWSGNVATLVDGDPFNGLVDIDGRYLTEPVSVTVDLGGLYEIKSIQIFHEQGKVYPEAKVEISENGRDWKTVFDAKVQGKFTEPRDGRTYTAE